MTLQRHEALRPFSREHVVGLYHAHQLMWLTNGRARCDITTTVSNFRRAWQDEITHHFTSEEVILAPLKISEASLSRLLMEHRVVRQKCTELLSAAVPSNELCFSLGHALEQHIRWEEHEFFPEIEATLSPEDLLTLGEQTKAMAESREKRCGL